jgi:hypothetical protein
VTSFIAAQQLGTYSQPVGFNIHLQAKRDQGE